MVYSCDGKVSNGKEWSSLVVADEALDHFSHILRPLGLSEYEVRVFLTLVMTGPANYRVISKESKVPIGKIYQVLSTLEAKGCIEVIQEKPKIYRAVEPKKALRRRLKQLEEDSFELERKIREALPTLQLQYSLKHDIIQGLVSEILVGCNSFSKNIQETLMKALYEVLIVTARFDVKPHEVDMFKHLLERGVSVRVLCSDVEKNSKHILDRLLNLGLGIRMQDTVTEKYYVIDDKYATTFINNFEEDVCLQIHCSTLCKVLRERFEEKWATARIMKAKAYKSSTSESIVEEKVKL